MPNQISDSLKHEQQQEIMELQQEIAFEKAEQSIGLEVWAMIEGKVSDDAAYIARTYKDAPNVDGFLFVKTQKELMTGDFVKVKVTGSN